MATGILLRFRQNAINEMITGINEDYDYKFLNMQTMESKLSI